jgi:hypothetical protein
MERLEQLASAGTTEVTTTMTPVGVAEQMVEQVPEKEASEQVAPEQGLPDPPTEGQVLKTSKDLPELTTTTKNST